MGYVHDPGQVIPRIEVENLGADKAGAWVDLFVDPAYVPEFTDKADASLYTGIVAPGGRATLIFALDAFTAEPEKGMPLPSFALLDEGLGCFGACLDTNLVMFEVDAKAASSSDFVYLTL